MKFTGAVVASLLASSVAAFDKYQRTPRHTSYYPPNPKELITNPLPSSMG
jgi:hypothetical protein